MSSQAATTTDTAAVACPDFTTDGVNYYHTWRPEWTNPDEEWIHAFDDKGLIAWATRQKAGTMWAIYACRAIPRMRLVVAVEASTPVAAVAAIAKRIKDGTI